MMPVEDTAFTAIRDADADRLSAGLDPSRCPPSLLRLLIRHEDPRLRGLGLVGLAERLAAGRHDRAEQAGFAAALPDSLDGPPEAVLALAHLYLRLRAHVRPRPWPRWREADLPARVRIAWLSAEGRGGGQRRNRVFEQCDETVTVSIADVGQPGDQNPH